MKPTVLIAEDDGELSDLYRRYFIRRDYDVETASDGVDCLDKLRLAKPAVLVLDMKIRWGGGDGVLAWLREEDAMSGLAVVLTNSCCAQAAADTEPPVVKQLLKPFSLTALFEEVRAAVDLRQEAVGTRDGATDTSDFSHQGKGSSP
jgi:DNA-binding NtrC family response regulator